MPEFPSFDSIVVVVLITWMIWCYTFSQSAWIVFNRALLDRALLDMNVHSIQFASYIYLQYEYNFHLITDFQDSRLLQHLSIHRSYWCKPVKYIKQENIKFTIKSWHKDRKSLKCNDFQCFIFASIPIICTIFSNIFLFL